jgi:hypothetical protein
MHKGKKYLQAGKTISVRQKKCVKKSNTAFRKAKNCSERQEKRSGNKNIFMEARNTFR